MDRAIKKILTFFSLFGSLSTLLCCALPVTLVTLGMGAAFASLTANVPGLIWLMERKDYLFMITALLLIISYVMMRKSHNMPCPVDVDQRELCQSSKDYSKITFWITVAVYIVGVTFSYIIPLIIY